MVLKLFGIFLLGLTITISVSAHRFLKARIKDKDIVNVLTFILVILLSLLSFATYLFVAIATTSDTNQQPLAISTILRN